MIQALSDYQNALASTLRTNEYNEHSFRTFLENLLNVLKNDDKCYIIHEPKAEVGQGHIRPDYKVYKRIDSKNTLSYNALMGFIECKQWGEDLNAHIKGKQLDKYLQICPNIMLTNHNRFILISFGTIISDTTLFDYGLDTHLFKDMQDSILAHKLKDFQALLSDFFNATQAAIKSKAEVIKILSTQSFYLALKARESYHEPRRTSFHKFFEKTYETFRNITRYEFAQEEFCDILGQSVVYGLLVAHLESESYSKNDKHIEITQLEGFVNLLPKEFALLSEFIYFAIPSFHIPASVAYALENIKKAIALIDKRTLATALNTQIESVAIYLYEDFLKAYDELRGSEKRKEGGVFYTPQSVVNCIVSSIHEILKKYFNKPKGLAHKDVKVLDFATGTGSFLAKVFELILQEEQSKIFQIMDIKDKFLKDIYGFELSFVPYIVAHIKLSTILKNAGFSDFSDEHKLQIFLTNTLDLSINADYQMTMPLVLLEEQDKEARKIKHKEEVLVILGNPPYYQNSKNNLPEIIKLHNTYKVGLNETNLQPLNNDYIKFIRFAQWKLLERTDPDPKAEVPLFIDSHSGIMGFITPNSYLYGRVHRKMRESLYTNFDSIYIINLHGDNEKDEREDENVFDIRVGVCISLFVKCNSSLTQDTRITNNKKCKSLESLKIQSENSNLNTSLRDFEKVEAIHNKTSHKDSMDCHEAKASRNDNAACHTEAKVSHKNIDSNSNIQRNKDSIQERTSHSTIYCKEATLEQSPKLFYFSTANNHIFKRADKYNLLNDIAYKGLDCIQWQELRNKKLGYGFRRQFVIDSQYIADFICLAKRLIIECDGGGHNGNFKDIERDFYLQSHNFRILRFWNNEILENLGGGLSQHSHIQKIAYRPFDTRYTFFSGKTKGFLGYPRYDPMQHFLQGENLGLCFPKQTYNPYFDYGFVIDVITDVALGGKNTGSETYIAPLYRYQNTTGDDNTQTDKIEKIPNFTESFRNYCQSHTILKHKSPEQILYFIYANLYNPIYRNKYAEYLKIGFPRIHFDVEESYFDTLESYGKKLIALHLMRETPKDSTIILDFRENANTNNPSLAIKKLNANKRHLAHCFILNDDLHITGVSEDVYNYTIGGYKVIEKWFSYRADYVCSKAELEHLVNICKVIKATLTLEQELEKC
ncbi:type ISP restriction/modification enzyme [uncultured Helicobacter sp.]|uniref:type ISP restriction/modification enzyme n=1 Tax=uncultured Helicobacter sp. TaxID=175537 RepID=UPI002637363A|nr:type ISP restriction/modification enzyme [uncultured Helicobacter sp.]